MNKKKLTVILLILVLILIAGFFLFKDIKKDNFGIENSLGGSNTESQTIEVSPGIEVTAQGTNGGGQLTICADNCGDKVCQQPTAECGKEGNLDCICPEDPETCPQDCK